ncbi:long-chain fatty acid--CoA ligase [SAR92 clade bacterium H231]|nr:long-chain fatty acid--CoA ligase [SAR92 clade bacterium H231]
MIYSPLSVPSIIRFAAENHSDQEIVSRLNGGAMHRYSYADCYQRIAKLANALQALGVTKGDVVGTIAWNSYQHVELYYAISGIGAICHTINPRMGADRLAWVVAHAQDKLVFFDSQFSSMIDAAGTINSVNHWIALEADSKKNWLPPHSVKPLFYETLINEQRSNIDWPDLDENTSCGLCYTSGTTGKPKGVCYTHRSTVLHAMAICMTDVLGLSAMETILPVVPMFHVNAWGLPYGAPMSGAKLVLPGPMLDGESLANLIDQENVTSAYGVPTVWMGLLDYLDRTGRQLPSLKRLVSGGSAVSGDMLQRFREDYGVTVINAWGMTETSPVGTVNMPKQRSQNISQAESDALALKQGRGVFGLEMRLADTENRPLPRDGQATGELQVRGHWVTEGYLHQADLDALTEDGWFRTGDIASIDPQGYMHISDRAKDMIKSGGEWISSIELENAALSHPGVAQAAVIAVPHPKWQERPLLIACRSQTDAIAATDLRDYVATQLEKWMVPDAVEFIDEMPLGATGKIDKVQLRKIYQDYRLKE